MIDPQKAGELTGTDLVLIGVSPARAINGVAGSEPSVLLFGGSGEAERRASALRGRGRDPTRPRHKQLLRFVGVERLGEVETLGMIAIERDQLR